MLQKLERGSKCADEKIESGNVSRKYATPVRVAEQVKRQTAKRAGWGRE